MRALVVLLLAGCWHDVPPPVAPAPETSSSDDDPMMLRRYRRSGGPDCSSLVPAMEQLFNRNNSGLQPQMAPIIEAVITSCTEDGWSTDLVQCFTDASDVSTAQDCARQERGLLTPEQMQQLQNRIYTAMKSSMTPPPPPTP